MSSTNWSVCQYHCLNNFLNWLEWGWRQPPAFLSLCRLIASPYFFFENWNISPPLSCSSRYDNISPVSHCWFDGLNQTSSVKVSQSSWTLGLHLICHGLFSSFTFTLPFLIREVISLTPSPPPPPKKLNRSSAVWFLSHPPSLWSYCSKHNFWKHFLLPLAFFTILCSLCILFLIQPVPPSDVQARHRGSGGTRRRAPREGLSRVANVQSPGQWGKVTWYLERC